MRWHVTDEDIRPGVQAAAERLAEILSVTRTIAEPCFDHWLAGYLRGHPDATVTDGVSAWLEQEGLEVHLVESEDVTSTNTT